MIGSLKFTKALGTVYERSDHVFHGKVVDINYLIFDLQSPIVTFENTLPQNSRPGIISRRSSVWQNKKGEKVKNIGIDIGSRILS